MTDLTDAVIFLSLAFGVLLVVWLVRKAIRFALGPPPGAKEPVGVVYLHYGGNPTEGVHGVYDPRPYQRGLTERYERQYGAPERQERQWQWESLDRSKKAWLN